MDWAPVEHARAINFALCRTFGHLVNTNFSPPAPGRRILEPINLWAGAGGTFQVCPPKRRGPAMCGPSPGLSPGRSGGIDIRLVSRGAGRFKSRREGSGSTNEQVANARYPFCYPNRRAAPFRSVSGRAAECARKAKRPRTFRALPTRNRICWNGRARICRPLHNHSGTSPHKTDHCCSVR